MADLIFLSKQIILVYQLHGELMHTLHDTSILLYNIPSNVYPDLLALTGVSAQEAPSQEAQQ